MRKLIPVVSLLIVVMFFTLPAHAEIKARTFSVTPYIGGYTFERNEDLSTRPVYGLRFGYDITKRWGIEGAFDYVRTDFSRNNVTSGVDAYGYRLEAVYNFLPDSKLVPFVAAGLGGRSTSYKDVPNDRNQFLGDYGAGVKYFLTQNLALRGDIRHLIGTNDTFHNLEYTIGLSYYFGSPKAAAAPQAEAAPAVAPAPPTPKEEPPAAPINLKAKAASESQIDLRWNEAKGATGYKVYRDGSYIVSSKTAALADKGLKADTRYCYKVTATDDKGRESVVSNEACAATPAPPMAMQEVKKESAAAAAVAKEMFEKGRATINIEFDTNKAVVKPRYHEEIKKFAEVMKNYPELKVIIEGHTDNVGGKAYNQKLSQRRAESVKKYMVDKFGIDASRLTAKGYGMSKPIADNKTKAGKQKNRRVEAVVDYTVKK